MPGGPLGRIESPDDRHRRLFSAAAVPEGVIRGQGGVAGIAWLSSFDHPEQDPGDGRHWIGRDPNNLGSVRGGHAICGHIVGVADTAAWWRYYDQGREWPGKPDKDYSSCVGMSVARYATNKNRRKYDPYDIYHWAQDHDPWDGSDYEGTDLRSGFDCLRLRGPRRVFGQKTYEPDPADGIAQFVWATRLEQVRAALNVPDHVHGIPFLQSWGPGYPHIVWMPDETADIVLFRRGDGEFGIITDLP